MKRFILSFAHDDVRQFAGGLAKYIREETALAEERGIDMVTVFPLHVRSCPWLAGWASRGWGVCRGHRWVGIYGWRGLAALLGNWEKEGEELSEIQLHYIGGYDAEDLRRFLLSTPVPVHLFLHDYHTVCRSNQLLRNGLMHCGTAAPCEAKCRDCRSWDAGWLPRMKTTLAGVEERLKVTAPSESAATGWIASWPEYGDRVEVVPHWLATQTVRGTGRDPGKRLKLAFAGAQLPHKGWPVWCRVAEALWKAGAGIDCLYFGAGRDVPPGVRAVKTGMGEMTAALRREGVDFLCLWSIWPETYSYVYYEATLAGAWVLAPETSGNIADAIRKDGWGTVFRDAEALSAFLLDERAPRAVLERAKGVERPVAMVVNPHVVDALPEPRFRGLRGGWARRSWAHEILWKLKERTSHV